MSLEPIDPESALELYLADRKNNVTEATIRSHRSRLGHFIRWCDNEEITNLDELTGRKLHRYRLWRRDEGDLAPATEKTQMDTLWVFIKTQGGYLGVFRKPAVFVITRIFDSRTT